MKTLLLVLLIVAATITGCGGSSQPAEPTAVPVPTFTPTAEPVEPTATEPPAERSLEVILVPTDTPTAIVVEAVQPTPLPIATEPPATIPVVAAPIAPVAPTNPPFACAGGCAQPPDPSCAIKGNFNGTNDEKIFHQPGGRWYDNTDIIPAEGDVWFCTAQEAIDAGYREAGSR